jgi:hypothetical protein
MKITNTFGFNDIRFNCETKFADEGILELMITRLTHEGVKIK